MLCSISAKAEFDTRVRYGIGNVYSYLDFSSMEAIIAPDNSYSGSLVIPEKLYSGYGTFTITGIYAFAFDDCDGLTSVTIPNSVTSIGDRAFYVCESLKSITIPNSVTSIGDCSFYACIYNHRTTKTNQKYPSVNL